MSMNGLKKRRNILILGLLLLSAVAATTLVVSGVQTRYSGVNSKALAESASQKITIKLRHSPTGIVDLTWKPEDQQLTVKVKAIGLAPNSIHPEHIHVGTCTSSPMGAVIYTLQPLQANAHGVGESTTTFSKVLNGIPTRGWYVNIHNGPTLSTPLEARAIACGNVDNKQTSLHSNQKVHLKLTTTMAPDEAVQGKAQIHIEENKFILTLTVHGLAPNTTHMAHIHAGSCTAQGPVVMALPMVVADAQGNATITTDIQIGKIKALTTGKPIGDTQLYINIHEAGTMSGMSVQQGFNPIACGNIQKRESRELPE